MRPTARAGDRDKGSTGADLDMVPMMNLFTVLVPVLLLAAVFARVSVLELSIPPKGSGEEGMESYEEKSPLNLLVVVSEEGITVGGTGGFLPTLMESDGADRPGRLASLLQVVRDKYPDETKVTVASESNIPYEEILEVMDICRDGGFLEIALCGLHSAADAADGEG
jgi:biopolymer transport protein ExbD